MGMNKKMEQVKRTGTHPVQQVNVAVIAALSKVPGGFNVTEKKSQRDNFVNEEMKAAADGHTGTRCSSTRRIKLLKHQAEISRLFAEAPLSYHHHVRLLRGRTNKTPDSKVHSSLI